MADENANTTATATLDIEDMIEHPEKYGFAWGYGALAKSGMQLTTAAPHIVHKDLNRMREVFGDDYFLASANGQSARVRDQTLREDIWADRTLAKRDKDMKRIVLERALGRKSRRGGTVTVFKGLGGVQYATELEMNQGNIAWLMDNGLVGSIDEAKQMLNLA